MFLYSIFVVSLLLGIIEGDPESKSPGATVFGGGGFCGFSLSMLDCNVKSNPNTSATDRPKRLECSSNFITILLKLNIMSHVNLIACTRQQNTPDIHSHI
jgi:hypothetical protein